MDPTIEHLARYAVDSAFSNLPLAAVHECKRRVIDSVACATAAFDEPLCRTLRELSRHYAGTPAARLWGTGIATSVEMAGFVNGVMVRYLDCSDTWMGRGAGHPSDMIPALVALAEGEQCSGTDLINAIVVAYEVSCGLCEAAFEHRVPDQATAAAVGTAAGAARLLQLDITATGNALSLALAPNLHLYNVRCGTLSDWKGCADPNGARNGLFAATLARRGVSGPTAPIEGKGGLADLIGTFDWRAGHGRQPLLVDTHLKLHPVCYHGQTAVDAAIALHGRLGPAGPTGIAAVHIETHDAAWQVMGADPGRWPPTTRETADHSLPFTVAVALCEGRLRSAAYDPERLGDTVTRALMAKIRVDATADMTRRYPVATPVRITVTTNDGRVLAEELDTPVGHAANPVSDAGLEEKFNALCGDRNDAAAWRQALDRLWSLEHCASVKQLVDALCPVRRD